MFSSRNYGEFKIFYILDTVAVINDQLPDLLGNEVDRSHILTWLVPGQHLLLREVFTNLKKMSYQKKLL